MAIVRGHIRRTSRGATSVRPHLRLNVGDEVDIVSGKFFGNKGKLYQKMRGFWIVETKPYSSDQLTKPEERGKLLVVMTKDIQKAGANLKVGESVMIIEGGENGKIISSRPSGLSGIQTYFVKMDDGRTDAFREWELKRI